MAADNPAMRNVLGVMEPVLITRRVVCPITNSVPPFSRPVSSCVCREDRLSLLD